MPEVKILHGDCRAVMRTLAENSVDAIVTDAPYGLSREPDMGEVLRHWLAGDDYEHGSAGFMGRQWDSFVPGPTVWREALRVLKPGGFCLSFFGSRTFDMGVTAMRLAGFEIREMFAWLHGSGMPKVGYIRDEDGETHLREGWSGSVKPSLEPLVMARKPLSERTLALNMKRWGTGALNVDGCRVGTGDDRSSGGATGRRRFAGEGYGGSWSVAEAGLPRPTSGRWPSNVCHDGSQAVLDLFPETANNFRKHKGSGLGYGSTASAERGAAGHADSGFAARFYNAFPPDADPFIYHPKANKRDRAGSKHPTVKPQGLMRHYCRLVTPPGGTVLDVFAGSGSTLQAARDEGFDAIGIEMEAQSVADCYRRLGLPLPAAIAAA